MITGNGGFIETSGKALDIDGAKVSTAAPNGVGGHWLLDPSDYVIDAAAASSIDAALVGGDVVIATYADGNPGNGDIFVNAPISWNTNNILTLDAYHSLFVNANIAASGDVAAINITYNDGGSGGYFLTGQGASVTLSGANPLLAINGQPTRCCAPQVICRIWPRILDLCMLRLQMILT